MGGLHPGGGLQPGGRSAQRSWWRPTGGGVASRGSVSRWGLPGGFCIQEVSTSGEQIYIQSPPLADPIPGASTRAGGTHATGMHSSCYRPQRSCEGYVFTPVCHSVHGRGVSASVHVGIPPPTLPPQEKTPPLGPGSPEQAPPRSRHSPLGRRLLLRTVRILLEWILVVNVITS